MRLLIVIVNYRTSGLTLDCLASLAPELRDLSDVKVVVTDNLSKDDSVDTISRAIADRNWSWATFMPLPENGGFAYGNNAAIAPALASTDKPEYVLLLNPDTVVHPGAIHELLKFMDAHPDAGIAGSRLEDPDGTPQCSAFKFHGILSELDRGIRMGWVARLLRRWTVPQAIPTSVSRTDWVAGASMIIRRTVFERVGLLDSKYFMYFEEVDFCLRVARAGFQCWYVPESRVIHLVGAASQLSGPRHRKRRPRYWFDARRRFFVKNYGILYAGLADLAFATGFALWRLRVLVRLKDDCDPPRMLWDSIRNSVFLRGTRV